MLAASGCYKQHCLMHWHSSGGLLELTPLTQESTTNAHLEQVQSKLDELSERGWELVGMTATQGKHTFVLRRDATLPRVQQSQDLVTKKHQSQVLVTKKKKDKKKKDKKFLLHK